MIKIAISQAAFDAIAATLPLGSVGYENAVNEGTVNDRTKSTHRSRRQIVRPCCTGASVEDVEKAIRQAAAEDGEYPTHLCDTSFRHQIRAVEMLGFELFHSNSGIRVRAHSISLQLREDWLFQPTPAEFLQANQSDDLLLCLAHVRPGEPNSEVHTFAVHRRCYYDNNPGGIRGSVPMYFVSFRMMWALACADLRSSKRQRLVSRGRLLTWLGGRRAGRRRRCQQSGLGYDRRKRQLSASQGRSASRTVDAWLLARG